MIVIGFDPGLATTGFGILAAPRGCNKFEVIEYGVINTGKDEEFAARLARIFDEAVALLDRHHPAAAGIEQILFAKNTTTALLVAQASGVIKLACEKNGIPIQEYTPPEVKKTVVGYGQADKIQVQRVIPKLTTLKEIPRPDDAADALAIAICCALTFRRPGKC